MHPKVKACVLAALVLLAPWVGRGEIENADWLSGRLAVHTPAAGDIGIEILPDASGKVMAAAASYSGPGLPAEDTIVLRFTPPASGRVYAARIVPRDRHWAVPRWVGSLERLPELTQYALWETDDGGYGVMVVMTGGGLITYLSGDGRDVLISGHSHDEGFAPSRVPMFTIGFGDDPYALTHKVYDHALQVMREIDPDGVIGRLRSGKTYPEVFDYLGWCSWNAHYTEATQDNLIENARSLKNAGLPVRWMIIDDGWHTLVETESKGNKKRGRSLAGFDADPVKFPDGFAGVTRALKIEGITWVGAWMTLQGYWNGVAIDSPLGRDFADALMPVSDQVALPDPRSGVGQKFWDAFFDRLSEQGIDFIKTDDQSTQYQFTEGLLPVSAAYAGSQRNFQAAAQGHFDSNVINCMSMNVDTIYQWDTTSIARASRDFYPLEYHDPRQHTVDCVMNALWLGELVWPDYDMWQSYNWHARYHAVARAVSGGPVYFTDEAGKERPELIRPLALADGRLLRADQPARPTRRSLFVDPYMSLSAFTAFAPVGTGGVIGAWNVNRFELPVMARVSPSDIEGIAGDDFVVYEYFSGKTWRVARNDEIKETFKGWDARVYTVSPIAFGFAPIGLTSKYVPAAAIREVLSDANRSMVVLAESGPFAAWCERQPARVAVNRREVDAGRMSFRDNILHLDLDEAKGGSEEIKIEIAW